MNQDSFPEMEKETMGTYLKAIPKICRSYFLSINQEAQALTGSIAGEKQGWVFEFFQNDPLFTLSYRITYWLRKGYTEELWLVANPYA